MAERKSIKAFISYAHKDKYYADFIIDNLITQSKRSTQFNWEFWSDVEIPIGEKWFDHIKKQIADSDCAILFVSPEFYASEFIDEHEVNEFIKKVDNETKPFLFFPLLLRYVDISLWTELAQRQFFKPLSEKYNQPSNPKFSYAHLVSSAPNPNNPLSGYLDDYYSDFFDALENSAKLYFIKDEDLKLISTIREKAIIKSSYKLTLREKSNIPNSDSNFVGRKKYVDELELKLKDNHAVSVTGLNGMGGVGKTAIIIEVCNKIKKSWENDLQLFKDGILWLRLEKNQTLEIIAENIENQIGIYIDAILIEDKFDKIISILRTFKILVVIDSAEQNEYILNFLLSYFQDFPILVTSRKTIPQILDTIDINIMDKVEAQKLFLKHFKLKILDKDIQIIEKLCSEVGYLPLAIKILASRAMRFKLTKSIENIYDEFISKRISILKITINSQSEEEKKNSDAMFCFNLSFDDLDDLYKNILMSACTFEHPFSIERINDFFDEKDVTSEVDELVELSLVEKDTRRKKYFLHPLIKEFVVEKATTAGLFYEKYNRRKVIYLKQLENNHFSDLEEIVFLVNDLYEKRDTEYFFRYLRLLNEFLDKKGLWENKIQLNLYAISLSEKMIVKEEKGKRKEQFEGEKLTYLYSIADTLGRQGKYSILIKYYSDYLRLAPKKDFFAIYSILSAEYSLNNFQKSFYGNFVNIRECSKISDFLNLGRFIKTTGWIYNDFGFYELAFICAKTNLSQKKWRNNNQRFNLIKALLDLVEVHHKKGEYNKALPIYTKLLHLSQINNSTGLIVSILADLVSIYIELNKLEIARSYFDQYLNLKVNMGDISDEVEILSGKMKYAEQNYQDAFFEFSKIKDQEVKSYWLCKTLIELNNFDEAEKYFNSQFKICEKKKNPIALSNVLSLKSKLLFKKGNTFNAIEVLSKSIKTKEKYGIIDLKYEKEIKDAIIASLKSKGVEEDFYFGIAKNCKYIDILPDFITLELPQIVMVQDNKEMILIPEGECFIGKGVIKELNIETILGNIDEFTEQKPLHEGGNETVSNLHVFQLPINPNVNYNTEYFLELLEKSISLTKSEKQKVVDAFPRLDQSQVDELMKIFNEEKEKFSELEIEFKGDVEKLKTKRYYELFGLGLKDIAKQIYLYPYYMDKYPVTVSEYKAFCDSTSYEYPVYWNDDLIDENINSPVVGVSFDDATNYAKWAGKMLPTAHEWEKACRGEAGNIYPWGNKWDEKYTKNKFTEEISTLFFKTNEKNEIKQPDFIGELVKKKMKHSLEIPHHPNTKFDDLYFGYLLENSVSLTKEEKNRVIDSITRLNQNQIDELVKIFEEEQQKFSELEEEFKSDSESLNYEENIDSVKNLFQKFLKIDLQIPSDFGIFNMSGNILEWTCTLDKGMTVAKGGGWLAKDPSSECKGYFNKSLEGKTKRLDLGFRCVIPIFSMNDFNDLVGHN